MRAGSACSSVGLSPAPVCENVPGAANIQLRALSGVVLVVQRLVCLLAFVGLDYQWPFVRGATGDGARICFVRQRVDRRGISQTL